MPAKSSQMRCAGWGREITSAHQSLKAVALISGRRKNRRREAGTRPLSPRLFRSRQRKTKGWAMTLRWLLALGVGAVLLSLPALGGSQSAAEAQGRLIDFSQYHFGAVPDEFAYDATGSHGPVLTAGRPFWRVYTDPSAPSPKFVLIQASTRQKRDHYPLAFLRSFQAADVSLGVFVKLMGGVNASAGILWRAQDKDNYYAALARPPPRQGNVFALKKGPAL